MSTVALHHDTSSFRYADLGRLERLLPSVEDLNAAPRAMTPAHGARILSVLAALGLAPVEHASHREDGT